jgi:3-deoxy-manno-octulosonate cytidylyltransferase (CMP-KDO synthetase)
LTAPKTARTLAPQYEVDPETRFALAAVVVIPARYASTRFPAKIVAAETGKPLVQHVVDQVKLCKRVKNIIVAIDDDRIAQALAPFNTPWQMTNPNHACGTDRIAEVALKISDDIIINVQGDEPEIEPEIIDGLIERLETTPDQMATVATIFPKNANPADPNLVKCIVNAHGHAIYFSRGLIPFPRDPGTHPKYLLHLGIYAYRRDFLLQYASWTQGNLEQIEKLEQLRVIERGHQIFVHQTSRSSHGIDTPQQYADFVKRHQAKHTSSFFLMEPT